jgi:hypothetical protein
MRDSSRRTSKPISTVAHSTKPRSQRSSNSSTRYTPRCPIQPQTQRVDCERGAHIGPAAQVGSTNSVSDMRLLQLREASMKDLNSKEPICAVCDRAFSDHVSVISHDFVHQKTDVRPSKTVTAEHEQALKWARGQNFTSVAARYAKLCAEAYDIMVSSEYLHLASEQRDRARAALREIATGEHSKRGCINIAERELGLPVEPKESPLGRAVRIARGEPGPPTEPVRFAEKAKALPEPGPDLACKEFVPDPYTKFCDKCGYPRHEHRRQVNGSGEQT